MIKIEPSINLCIFEPSINKLVVEKISIKDETYFISYVQPVEETLEVK